MTQPLETGDLVWMFRGTDRSVVQGTIYEVYSSGLVGIDLLDGSATLQLQDRLSSSHLGALYKEEEQLTQMIVKCSEELHTLNVQLGEIRQQITAAGGSFG